jgi:hypothetical protein
MICFGRFAFVMQHAYAAPVVATYMLCKDRFLDQCEALLIEHKALAEEYACKEAVCREQVQGGSANSSRPVNEAMFERYGLQQEDAGHAGSNYELYNIQRPYTRLRTVAQPYQQAAVAPIICYTTLTHFILK